MRHNLRYIGFYLVKNPRMAYMVSFFCAMLPMVGVPTNWLGQLIVSFVTLNQGGNAGFFVSSWFLLPAVIVAFVLGHFILLIYTGGLAVLAWGGALALRRSQTWSLIIQCMALLGVLFIWLLHLVFPDIEAWWLALLRHNLSSMSTLLSRDNLIIVLSQYATGLQVSSCLLVTGFNLYVADAWKAMMLDRSSKYRENAFYNIRTDRVMAVLSVGCLLGGLFFSILSLRDAIPVILLPFLISGFSLCRAVLAQYWASSTPQYLFYGMFLLFWPYFAVLVMLVGWLDSWYDLRAYSKAKLNDMR